MRAFTKNKDADRTILSNLEKDSELINACILNKYTLSLCDENFFRNRMYLKYPNQAKNKIFGSRKSSSQIDNMSWKNFYLQTVYYIDKLEREYDFQFSKLSDDARGYYKLFQQSNDDEYRLEQASQNGWIDLVEFLILNDSVDYYFGAITSAALGRDFRKAQEILKFLIKKNRDDHGEIEQYVLNDSLNNAAYAGNRELIDYLISIGANNMNFGLYGATRAENEELINFFISKGADDWAGAILRAAKAGNEDLVYRFIYKLNGKPFNIEEALYNAAISGNKELVYYFIELGAHNWNRAMAGAALGDHEDLVKYFISRGADNWPMGRNFSKRGSKLYDFFYKKI